MTKQIPKVLLDLQQWDQLSYEECLEVALQVERLLPPSFQFANIQTYYSSLEYHRIAHFRWTAPPGTSLTHDNIKIDPAYSYKILTRYLDAHSDLRSLPQDKLVQIQNLIEERIVPFYSSFPYKQYSTTFALIPGNNVVMGYNKTQPYIPRDDFLNEWKEYHATNQSINEYIEDRLFPQRIVNIQPFLLETDSLGIGDFLEILAVYHEEALQYPLYTSGFLSFDDTSNYPVTHKLVTSLVEKQGFRLPTSNEWEYCSMAGRKQLFFWEESSKLLEYYPELPPNTFGLQIANNSDRYELCIEPGILRGGDGGETQCGWEGLFAFYLTFTSAYYYPYRPTSEIYAYFRRAYSL